MEEITRITRIVYCDETGDDGLDNSPTELFVLTSLSIPSYKWQDCFDTIKTFRKRLKEQYGFYTTQEMHTKNFVQNKNPYRDYGWNDDIRRDILRQYAIMIASLDVSVINVIIDKSKIERSDYNVLENALKYNIQRIENDSAGDWNYLIITDSGRIAPMKKTARKIRAYNPIESMYDYSKSNHPIKYMVEDIFEKDSKESYFVQLCDFISYFVFLYYRTTAKKQPLKNRISKVIDLNQIENMLNYFKDNGVFNLKANKANPFGLVIYPK